MMFCALVLMFLGAVEVQQPKLSQYDSLQEELSREVTLIDSLSILIKIAEYQNYRDQDASLYWLEIAYPLAEKLGDKSKLAAIYSLKGGVFMDKGKNPEALSLMKQALNIYNNLNDSAMLATSYTNIALCYQVNNLYDSAMVYYYKALSIDEARNDQWGLGYSYDNLGFIFYTMEDMPKAFEYLQKALELREQINDRAGIAITSIHLGGYYYKTAKYDSSLYYYKQGIGLFEQEGFDMHVSTAKVEMHEVYKTLGEYQEAARLLDEVLEFELAFNNLENILYTYVSKATLASVQENYQQAQRFLDECEKLVANEKQDAPLTNGVYVKLYEAYYINYKALGKFEQSLQAAIKHFEYKEKQALEEALLKLSMLESEQKLSSKEAELKAVQLNHDLLATQNKFFFRTMVLIVLLVALVLLGGGYIYFIRQRNMKALMAKSTELEKTNKALDRFVYSASHDLKAPIASSKGLINLMRMEQHSEILAQYLNMQESSLQKLEEFIVDILEYSRNTRTETKLEQLQFQELVEDTFSQLEHYEGADEVQKKLNIQQNEVFVSDCSRIKVLLNNLISNAFRYRNPYANPPKVTVNIRIDAERASIEVSDNGLGIRVEHQERIFDMFYRAHSHKNGSGLGLFIVKETIEKLGGIISMQSSPNSGTSFFIELPNLKSDIKGQEKTMPKTSLEDL